MVFDRDNGVCARCGLDCEKAKRVYWAILDSPAQWFYADLINIVEGRSLWEADHINERANGGSDSLDNLQTLCRNCHRVKSAMFLMKGDQKRVSLNVLVLPSTLIAIRELASEYGCSQGELVDRAVAALRIREDHERTLAKTGGLWQPPQASKRKPRPKVGPAFKGQLLRPSENKKR